CQQGYISPYSF
nr:immunoglobulin light chain junction region [Macaca mulatta]MOV74920.1 immunoglobulin light chain junction region [Macaca mulatta]